MTGWIVHRIPDRLPIVEEIQIQKLTAANVTYVAYGSLKRERISETTLVFTDRQALKAFIKPLVELRIKKLEEELKQARKRRKRYPIRSVPIELPKRPTNL